MTTDQSTCLSSSDRNYLPPPHQPRHWRLDCCKV